jgi:hypothetical protein
MDHSGRLLVVAHTFEEISAQQSRILDLSAESDKKGGADIQSVQAMKKEYDFSKGARGKFYRKGLSLPIPVYLEEDSAVFLRKVADQRGTDVEEIVNDWIRKDIDRIKSVS